MWLCIPHAGSRSMMDQLRRPGDCPQQRHLGSSDQQLLSAGRCLSASHPHHAHKSRRGSARLDSLRCRPRVVQARPVKTIRIISPGAAQTWRAFASVLRLLYLDMRRRPCSRLINDCRVFAALRHEASQPRAFP